MRTSLENDRGLKVADSLHRHQPKGAGISTKAQWRENGGAMFRVCEMIELTVHLKNGRSTLAKFMASATSCSARILACCCYCDRYGTVVRLVTEDAEKTAQALAAEGIACTRDRVVLVYTENSPTAPARIGASLAWANVQVLYSYSSWDEDDHSAVVFKTADNAGAVRLLRAQAAESASRTPESRGDHAKHSTVKLETQRLAA